MKRRAKDILVVGGTGALGFRICERLVRRGHAVTAIHRKENSPNLARLRAMGCRTVRCDIRKLGALEAALGEVTHAIFTPILTDSGPAFRHLTEARLEKAVLFSSANVCLPNPCQKYRAIMAEESAIGEVSQRALILRPAMIYGYAGDGNLSRILAAARRFPLTPMPGLGRARCQPIHVDDLADLTVKAILSKKVPHLAIAAGPTPLSMKGVMTSVRQASGLPGLVFPVPTWPLKHLSRLSGFPLDQQQIERADADRVPSEIPHIPGWHPQITLDAGLRRLNAALDAEAGSPHIRRVRQRALGGFHVRRPGHSIRHR